MGLAALRLDFGLIGTAHVELVLGRLASRALTLQIDHCKLEPLEMGSRSLDETVHERPSRAKSSCWGLLAQDHQV